MICITRDEFKEGMCKIIDTFPECDDLAMYSGRLIKIMKERFLYNGNPAE